MNLPITLVTPCELVRHTASGEHENQTKEQDT